MQPNVGPTITWTVQKGENTHTTETSQTKMTQQCSPRRVPKVIPAEPTTTPPVAAETQTQAETPDRAFQASSIPIPTTTNSIFTPAHSQTQPTYHLSSQSTSTLPVAQLSGQTASISTSTVPVSLEDSKLHEVSKHRLAWGDERTHRLLDMLHAVCSGEIEQLKHLDGAQFWSQFTTILCDSLRRDRVGDSVDEFLKVLDIYKVSTKWLNMRGRYSRAHRQNGFVNADLYGGNVGHFERVKRIIENTNALTFASGRLILGNKRMKASKQPPVQQHISQVQQQPLQPLPPQQQSQLRAMNNDAVNADINSTAQVVSSTSKESTADAWITKLQLQGQYMFNPLSTYQHPAVSTTGSSERPNSLPPPPPSPKNQPQTQLEARKPADTDLSAGRPGHEQESRNALDEDDGNDVFVTPPSSPALVPAPLQPLLPSPSSPSSSSSPLKQDKDHSLFHSFEQVFNRISDGLFLKMENYANKRKADQLELDSRKEKRHKENMTALQRIIQLNEAILREQQYTRSKKSIPWDTSVDPPPFV
ncbi:hypothetical protein BCR43DRAFT_483081 [Syncephalastrum racemosum]|uniref:Uncharacterized protein n=1 Tax=Syncephalastrum racemosum TaxID=13706 RepID=A0A1X2HUS4_SYNRA|nr:hypothetical protein BCR43DRAFT_483081 [Syncephalastrum racemosum]